LWSVNLVVGREGVVDKFPSAVRMKIVAHVL
jgi:hypothetical protein